jgi:hypothetical protein
MPTHSEKPTLLTPGYDMSWTREVRPGTNVVHIIPMRDLRPHRAGIDCECQPQRILPPFGSRSRQIVMLHAAWDCRELLHPEEESNHQAAVLLVADEVDGADSEADDLDDSDGEEE